jgi:hypothetical protein
MMKRLRFPALALLPLALLPIHAQERAPHIVFDSQTKDCGKIAEGEPLKHVFRFTNTGDATLEIIKVEPS